MEYSKQEEEEKIDQTTDICDELQLHGKIHPVEVISANKSGCGGCG